MLHLKLNYLEAVAVAVIIYYLGVWLKKHFSWIRNFYIPEAVAGGLVFAVVKLFLYKTGICHIQFDNILQMFFMALFFTSVGFVGKASFVRQGGNKLVKLGVLIGILIILQNILSIVIVKILGQSALLGIAAGSMPMVGGHGSAGVFGPILDDMGVNGAFTSSMAMATFGLIMGGLIGGPVAGALIKRYKLKCLGEHSAEDLPCELDGHSEDGTQQNQTDIDFVSSPARLMRAAALLFFAMGLGSIVCDIGEAYKIFVPPYAGSICVAAILRNLESPDTKSVFYIPLKEILVLAEVGLNIFLSMALMSLNLWQLSGLVGSLAAIAVGQMVLMALFTYFIVFPVLGKTYEAAVIVAGICGFGLGAVPTAMANMQSITNRFGNAPLAFLMVPVIGSLADGINTTIIVLLVNLLK